eukprot:12416011-Karenia_brevis.AAC.1
MQEMKKIGQESKEPSKDADIDAADSKPTQAYPVVGPAPPKNEESGNPPQEDPREAEIRDLQANASTRRTARANEVGPKTDEIVPIHDTPMIKVSPPRR